MHIEVLEADIKTDILVIGSGIAGVNAAVSAAEEGFTVTLITKGKCFSGSSFYPGTWGLGLIGPENEKDIPDLEQTILTVGCSMANSKLVHTFVTGIPEALNRIRERGVHLRTASQKDQKEFIPCFDHKHRDWNGLEFDSVKMVFSRLIQDLSIQVLENCEVLELAVRDQTVYGAVLYDGESLHFASVKSIVLATGGYGSLYRYHLCTEDVEGIGQALALDAGCSLINMEFMQMMPGYVSPAARTIFNERAFHYVSMWKSDGTPLLPKTEETTRLLQLRSSHGPFTTRLESRALDIALFQAFLEDESGVFTRYSDEIKKNPPEFVTTYFDWLREKMGITINDPIYLGVFAHAANGGVEICEDASTPVRGLFAAGEVTGGMHGADRIGGLSTANGLVFGEKAGRAAARYCATCETAQDVYTFSTACCENANALFLKLQQIMFRDAMILRCGPHLQEALQKVQILHDEIILTQEYSPSAAAAYKRLKLRLDTAGSILTAALLRAESRGSHYREDYPLQGKATYRIRITKKDGQLSAEKESLAPCPPFPKF